MEALIEQINAEEIFGGAPIRINAAKAMGLVE